MRSVGYSGLCSKATTLILLIALTVTFSMVSLAANRPIGELIVGPASTNDGNVVTVDGEKATSGRTVFSSSVIATPEEMGATLNLGKLGRLELGPATRFIIASQGEDPVGELRSGSLTAYGNQPISVRTANGSIVRLNAGEMVDATSASPARKSSGSFPAWGWAAILGVVAGVIIIAVVASNNGNDNQVSPVR